MDSPKEFFRVGASLAGRTLDCDELLLFSAALLLLEVVVAVGTSILVPLDVDEEVAEFEAEILCCVFLEEEVVPIGVGVKFPPPPLPPMGVPPCVTPVLLLPALLVGPPPIVVLVVPS